MAFDGKRNKRKNQSNKGKDSEWVWESGLANRVYQ